MVIKISEFIKMIRYYFKNNYEGIKLNLFTLSISDENVTKEFEEHSLEFNNSISIYLVSLVVNLYTVIIGIILMKQSYCLLIISLWNIFCF